MTVTVTLDLNDAIWRRARRLAERQQQAVADALVDWLAETLPPSEQSHAPADDAVDVAVEREMRAYITLHPLLRQQYLGHYVAIFGGQLVDHDADYEALCDRIDALYPDRFVWLTQVGSEPIQTLAFRSPRLEPVADS